MAVPATLYIKQPDGTWAKAKEPGAIRPVFRPAGNASNVFDSLKARATEWPYDLDMTGVTYVGGMFGGASALVVAPVMDLSLQTSTQSMFSSCASLTDVPTYNTSKVTSMSGMFSGCSSLVSVPMMDTSKVTNAGSMFQGTTKLRTIPAFNFSAVTNADSIFSGSGITSLPDLDFRSIAVINAGASPWFGSSNTTLATIGNLNLSGASSLVSFFSGMSGLQSIAGLVVSSLLSSTSNMFLNCSKLTSAPSFGTLNVNNATAMFSGCAALTVVPDLNLPKAQLVSSMFSGCTSLVTAPNIATAPALTSTSSMFSSCSKLTTISAFDTSGVTSAGSMFSGCSALTSVPAFNFGAVTGFGSTFSGCTSLTSILATGFRYAFTIAGCKLDAAALNALFTNLGTAAGAQTITITGNPGAATCDRSIATAKGWTVTG